MASSKEPTVSRKAHTALSSAQEAAARPGWAMRGYVCVSTEMRSGFAGLKTLDTNILPTQEVR